MAIQDDSYYAIESLTFLYKFKNSRWTQEDIGEIVSRSNETKSIIKELTKNSSEGEVRKVLKEIKKKGIKIEDQGEINSVLRRLDSEKFIETKQRTGSKITDAAKNLNLYQIVQLFEKVGLTPCTQDPESFDCARKNNGFCLTFNMYKKISDVLKEILKNITLKDIIEEKWDIKNSIIQKG